MKPAHRIALSLTGLCLLALGAASSAPRSDDDRRYVLPPSSTASEWVQIPLPGERLRMQAMIERPPGTGPFPLAIIAHGSSQSSVERVRFTLPDYGLMKAFLRDRGYMIVTPIRPGHGVTGEIGRAHV